MLKEHYWIEQWAKVRQDEMVRFPETFDIHEVYLKEMTREDFETAFQNIWQVFNDIYGAIAIAPATFGLPLYECDVYSRYSTQARTSRIAPFRPAELLFNLFTSGEVTGGALVVDSHLFKQVNGVKNLPILFERLGDYGFYFEGLKAFKVGNSVVEMTYPDNPNLLTVLKRMADKAKMANRILDFYSCHYKLFKDDEQTADYGLGADMVADKMHTDEERQFVFELDGILRSKGYFSQALDWNEGPTFAYYGKESELKSKGPYHFLLVSWKTKLMLYLRIRNVSKCLDFLEDCPETVKAIFRWGDKGCAKRVEKSCTFGQEYTFEGKTYWRCGCCNAPFYFSPKIEDIPYYMTLIELGLKK